MSKKFVKLNKGSENGYGFSIIGGVGTKIPPIVYEVIPGSSADRSKKVQQGDVIVSVNNKPVSSFTTKEVLNCLRDSPNEVNLELISDKSLDEKIKRFLHDPGSLKEAITQEELQGVNTILVKKNGIESAPPPLPAKVSVTVDHGKDNTSWHSLDRKTNKSNNCSSSDSFEDEKFESCADIVDGVSSTKYSKQERDGAGSIALPERSAGETPICTDRSDVLTKSEELTKTQYPQMPSSKSVPNSPSIAIISNSLSNKKMHQIRDNCNVTKINSTNCCEETNSSCSSLVCVSCESNDFPVTTINETDRLFSYSPSAIRISKSEDQLQHSDNAELSSANHDLEDDINASLNTLLDTKEDQSTNLLTSSANTSLVARSLNSNPIAGSGMVDVSISSCSIMPSEISSSKNDVTISPSGVVHSSHGDSDNPLTQSPPCSQSHFVSPNSSLHFSSNGIYSKIDNRKDDSFSITSSGNICSNSSSLATSPDTDIPDELEWDVSVPPIVSKQNGQGGPSSNSQKVSKKPLSFDDSTSLSSTYGIKTRKNEDENRIVIKVAGPEKSSSPTISRSNSEIDMKNNMNSNCRTSHKTVKDNGVKYIGGEDSTTKSSPLRRDINSCDSNQLMSMGVIPGSDFDVTPTNSPHQSPLNSPNMPDKPFAGAIRCRSSSPFYDQNSPPSHHQLSSPQTPCSGTLSPDTLAYQPLSESEDEFTNSFISEDDMRKSIGSISRNNDSVWDERDDGDCSESGNENIKAVSPPMSEDESDIESLHSFHFSPKAVDIPSAVRLARRLYILDGFKKTDVSRHLSKNNEFSRTVAEEYLQHFDFDGKSLDAALRIFLDRFCLTGETQERERVLVHFSKRFLDCNPGSFNSQDAAHTLTCALMLLNTDLHGANRTSRSMTCNEFIKNLAELNDGQDFDQVVLINLYSAVKKEPLRWVGDESTDEKRDARGEKSGPQFVSDNPFLAPVSGDGIVYKKGYIMRKCCSEPNGKRTSFGKRSWKMWWCTVQDLALYLHKDEQCGRRGGQHLPDIGSQAIRLHHGLATRASDYNKKQHVFRLRTADQAEYLFQTSDSKELQGWIDTINLVCASLSAPPMAEAVGSQRRFQRPLLPCSVTKLNLEEQTSDHEVRLSRFESQLTDHTANPPEKTAKTSVTNNFRERETYLKQEIQRYKTYVLLLRSRMGVAGDAEERTVITLGELFRHPPGEKAIEVPISRDGVTSKIVPPPIPDRSGRHIPDRLVQSTEGNSESEQEKLQLEKLPEKSISDNKLNSNSKEGAKLGKLKWLAAFFKFNKSNKKSEEEEILPPPLPPKPSPNTFAKKSSGN